MDVKFALVASYAGLLGGAQCTASSSITKSLDLIQALRLKGLSTLYSTPERRIRATLRAKTLIPPSSYEGLSYATLEAMACGTPAVASSAVPGEVVVNGFNGIRVNSYDPEGCANALERLLRDEELWLRQFKNGLEFVSQFDYVKVAKKYSDVVREVFVC